MPTSTLNLPLDNEEIWAEQIWQKTLGLIDHSISDSLAKCGKDECYRTCRECRDCKTFFYRCSLKFCPRCNWRIARKRSEIIKYWSLLVKQPKHVVLTSRNASLVSRDTLRMTMKAFGKLRRQKEWRLASGGCVSMEVTNESRGWHVHLHVLVDSRWIDAPSLSTNWGKLVGQDFAIVKVQDCRERQYLNEVTKYVVKASQMAAWPAEEIAAFIGAIRGVKFFAPFGSLYKMQAQIKAELDALKPEAKPCECGACDFIFETEESKIFHDLRKSKRG